MNACPRRFAYEKYVAGCPVKAGVAIASGERGIAVLESFGNPYLMGWAGRSA